ncbi:MAG: hypothetical protein ACYDCD_07900, partial [Candidatus Acidiferrales bacterium]
GPTHGKQRNGGENRDESFHFPLPPDQPAYIAYCKLSRRGTHPFAPNAHRTTAMNNHEEQQ